MGLGAWAGDGVVSEELYLFWSEMEEVKGVEVKTAVVGGFTCPHSS